MIEKAKFCNIVSLIMPTKEELKNDLFKYLETHTLINEFLGQHIRKRTEIDGWLGNVLIQIILLGDEEVLTEMLARTKAYSTELYSSFTKSIVFNNKQIDDQISDCLAELGGLYHLINERYPNLLKIASKEKKKGRSQKHPDFSSIEGEEKNVFEIKNLRTPQELYEKIVSRLTVNALLDPNKYSPLFELTIDPNITSNQLTEDKIDFFVAKIDCALVPSFSSSVTNTKKTVFADGFQRQLYCTIHHDKPHCVLIHCATRAHLPGLFRKTFEKTSKAIEQLLEYDHEDDCQKWILLTWQKPPGCDIFDNNTLKEFVTFLKQLKSLLVQINPKLGLKLLYDNSSLNI